MGSTEVSEPKFANALRTAVTKLDTCTDHELASWIVARLNYLVAGALIVEGDEFAHDTNEFGYKIKLTDTNKTTVAHGAVVIHDKRIYFASVNTAIDDFQSLFVELLTEFPDDLSEIEVRVRIPESKRFRQYGWDGYALFT